MKRPKDREKILGPGEKWLRPKNRTEKRIVVADARLIRWECYNPHNCTLIFTIMRDCIPYIHSAKISPGAERIECKPDGFAILNHSFYIITASDGRELITDLVQNYGRFIGIGNKLPARPLWE